MNFRERGDTPRKYTGMVKSYNRKGFGFIMCTQLENDLYFSRDSISQQLQTSDLAGETVTFEVRRFSDGRLQALNVSAVGDMSQFRGERERKGGGKGQYMPPPSIGSFSQSGSRDQEDRSRDWNCEACGERNFVKRFECFKCKKPRRLDGDPGPKGSWAQLRHLSPHAGSRAVRGVLRRSRTRSRSRRRKDESSSSSSSSDSSSEKKRKARSRSRKKRKAKKKKKKRDKSSSSSDDPQAQEVVDDDDVEELPSKDPPEIQKAKSEALDKLLKLKELEKEQRMTEWRALLRTWHPDKNPDNVEIATAVFQFLQKGKALMDS